MALHSKSSPSIFQSYSSIRSSFNPFGHVIHHFCDTTSIKPLYSHTPITQPFSLLSPLLLPYTPIYSLPASLSLNTSFFSFFPSFYISSLSIRPTFKTFILTYAPPSHSYSFLSLSFLLSPHLLPGSILSTSRLLQAR